MKIRKKSILSFKELQVKREYKNIEIYQSKFINFQQGIDSFINHINEEAEKEVKQLKFVKIDKITYNTKNIVLCDDGVSIGLDKLGFTIPKYNYNFPDTIYIGDYVSQHNKQVYFALVQDLKRIKEDYVKVSNLYYLLNSKLTSESCRHLVLKSWLTLFPECKVIPGWDQIVPYKKYTSQYNKSWLSRESGIDPIVVKEYITQASMEGSL